MKEQLYILENIENFEPKHIFECGQCFRWNKDEDESYTGVVGNNVLNVKKEKNNIIIKGVFGDNIQDICRRYFDLETDYNPIKEKLSNIDINLRTSIEYGKGIRILKQDVWETLISFIISANNNIPRIKGIIEKISKKYGKEIEWNNTKYYTFPTPEELSKANIKDLRLLGLGFRDSRVFETTQIINNKEVDLEKLEQTENIGVLREELLKFPGVGPKVADCIMLFSMKKHEVFPIDVWVKRVMTELYYNELIECKKVKDLKGEMIPEIKNQKILELAENKFGKLAGIAQQYLFYWRREN